LLRVQKCNVGRSHETSSSVPARTRRPSGFAPLQTQLTVEYMAEQLAEHQRAIIERLQKAEWLVQNLRSMPGQAPSQQAGNNV
jgi:hypothetical protein